MDSGWAVVVGAVIALVGSVAAPWVRDSIERRQRAEVERRAEIVRALVRLVDGVPRQQAAVVMGSSAGSSAKTAKDMLLALGVQQAVTAELSFLLTPKEEGIQHMAIAMWSNIDGEKAAPVLDFILITSRWLRDEITAATAAKEFFLKNPPMRSSRSSTEA